VIELPANPGNVNKLKKKQNEISGQPEKEEKKVKNTNSATRVGYVLGPAVILTYILMVMGNFVTSTGSGLACPDWPLCYGSVAPPLELDIWFEWGHRLLGATSGLFILLSTIFVWKSYKGIPRYLISTVAALLLLAVLIGGLIVIIEAPLLSTFSHIAVA